MSFALRRPALVRVLAGLFAAASIGPASASDEDLAAQLANPIASLISVPFQFNFDQGHGPSDGTRALLNIQPVVPIDIAPDWNLISRTILPIVRQEGFSPGYGVIGGLGDTVQSAFFSPKAPGPGGIIWGVGPVALLPTATDDRLGAGQWGLGPTGVALTQRGDFLFGGLANHVWSVAGESGRPDVNATFMHPFVTYLAPDNFTFFVNTEATYDWTNEAWSVPLNVGVNKLTNIGGQNVQLGFGLRQWLESPAGGPEGLGARINVIFAFPTGG